MSLSTLIEFGIVVMLVSVNGRCIITDNHTLDHDVKTLELLTTINTNPHITFIMEGRQPDEAVVLYSSGDIFFMVAFYNFSISPPGFNLVAGGPRGYQEGTGRRARFDTLSGSAYLNQTHIVVADSWNYCLRLVNLETGQTTLYVGTPLRKAAAQQSGHRLSISITAPSGIVKFGDKLIFADYYDSSLKEINGDWVRTVARSSSYIQFPHQLAAINGSIYCTVRQGVVRLNPAEDEWELFAGGKHNRSDWDWDIYRDGTLIGSWFYSPIFITAFSAGEIGSLLLVGDNRNKRLRIVTVEREPDTGAQDCQTVTACLIIEKFHRNITIGKCNAATKNSTSFDLALSDESKESLGYQLSISNVYLKMWCTDPSSGSSCYHCLEQKATQFRLGSLNFDLQIDKTK